MTASVNVALPQAAGSDAPTGGRRRAMIAGTVGHILEWYDFAVYGYLAAQIATNFFPSSDGTASLLASFATFGVGFLARPVGALIFGPMGDKRGRRTVLLITLTLMAASTLLIGILPTFASAGVLAPALLVAARLAQGLSAGGETSIAAIFLVEWAPPGRRGLFGSTMPLGSAGGLLLGSLMVAVVSSIVGSAAMAEWGWRIPFLIGGLLAPIAFVIRKNAGETPEFEQAKDSSEHKVATGAFAGMIFRAFMFDMLWAIGFYFFLSYLPTYAQRELGFGSGTTFWIATAGTAFHMLVVPLAGGLSDKVGRKPVILASCLGLAAVLYPLFSTITSSHSLPLFVAATLICAALLALYAGPAPATISELFPTSSRSTGLTLGYNLATLVFGGFTPFIATWLIAYFGSSLAPIYYLIGVAVLAAVFIMTLRETAWDQIRR